MSMYYYAGGCCCCCCCLIIIIIILTSSGPDEEEVLRDARCIEVTSCDEFSGVYKERVAIGGWEGTQYTIESRTRPRNGEVEWFVGDWALTSNRIKYEYEETPIDADSWWRATQHGLDNACPDGAGETWVSNVDGKNMFAYNFCTPTACAMKYVSCTGDEGYGSGRQLADDSCCSGGGEQRRLFTADEAVKEKPGSRMMDGATLSSQSIKQSDASDATGELDRRKLLQYPPTGSPTVEPTAEANCPADQLCYYEDSSRSSCSCYNPPTISPTKGPTVFTPTLADSCFKMSSDSTGTWDYADYEFKLQSDGSWETRSGVYQWVKSDNTLYNGYSVSDRWVLTSLGSIVCYMDGTALGGTTPGLGTDTMVYCSGDDGWVDSCDDDYDTFCSDWNMKTTVVSCSF